MHELIFGLISNFGLCFFLILILFFRSINNISCDEKKYRFGIDLGGTNIAVGLVDLDGKIVDKKSVFTKPERDYKLILKDMADCCWDLLYKNRISIDHVKSIGIGVPGRCDSSKKIIIHACNIKNLDNKEIESELRKYIDLPVYIDNDANCAALGENMFGASRNYKNSIMVTIGTGIGGGIIINNKILPDTEIGHQVIFFDDEACSCGRKGCWEIYGSANALIKRAKLYADKNPNSELNNINKNEINAKFIFDTADKNDLTAIKAINDYFIYLAAGISNLINIFSPEIILIGGGISAQKEKILVPLKKIIANQVYAKDLKTKLVCAELGNDAGIVGAAFLSY